MKNNENDNFLKYAFFKRLRTYGVMMETVVEFWYNNELHAEPLENRGF